MSSATSDPPVRRSALEAIHAGLGARWIAPDVRWPAAYDPPPASDALTIAEIGPRARLVVSGARMGAALAAAGLSVTTGLVSRAGTLESWGLAPDEVLLADAGAPSARTPSARTLAVDGELAARLRAAGAALSDVGAGIVQLRLAGATVRTLLEELTPVDLSEALVPDGAIVHAPLANVRVTLARRDRAGVPAFEVLLPRDLATYLWDAIADAGAAHGLQPVVDAGDGS